ncbi:MAG: FAD:protein FMN transferase [Paludibacteraceae bacterium]|nr:FAD:protein FMN transferase [Paludibacteraceae bacterium]
MGIAALVLYLFDEERPNPSYYLNQGKIFGTYYSIRYEATCDWEDSIQAALQAFDNSLSMFNPHSTLSAINANRDTITDALFEAMFNEAASVYELSDGAFDITVAPLVNAFGFGRWRGSTPKQAISRQTIDSLLAFVGFEKVQLVDHRIVKADPRVQLDGGAVAKGQSCDIIAALLERQGCTNYLVEIGGEIVSRGVNAKGEPWHIGITKPVEESAGSNQSSELQEVLKVNDICMATSGNYRNFYYDGEQKRSHTIDPRTGYPVQHSLLSATVVSSSCMRADALATACMVLGADKAMEMIERAGDAACYLIVDEDGEMVVRTSKTWKLKIEN